MKIEPFSLYHRSYTGICGGTKIKVWYVNGKKHRDDGPAVEYPNGHKFWWLDGKSYSQEEWFDRLTSEQKEKAVWNMDQW